MSGSRTVIIAGGTGYIGTVLRTTLTAEGYEVITIGRSGTPSEHHFIADITHHTALVHIAQTLQTNGVVLAGCIHAASPKLERVPFEKSSPGSCAEHLRTAVDGTFLMHHVFTPLCAERAAFIAITSRVVLATDKTYSMGAYPFAKQMQHQLVRTLALTPSQNLRYYTVIPDFLPGGLNNDLPTALQEHFATQKDGTRNTPLDVAHVCTAMITTPTAYPLSGAVEPGTNIVHPFFS